MTFVPRISACILAALMALPLAAQESRHRAVTSATKTTQVIITAKDAANGIPVENGAVTYGGQTLKTNVNGSFPITLAIGTPSTISIVHPAFLPLTTTITAQVGGKYDVLLTEKPSVTIITKTNGTHVIDIGTAQFGYEVTFAGTVLTDKANLCLGDGNDFTPDKTEFSRILGPATMISSPPCCQFGPVKSVNVEMKSGSKMQVFFKDSCSGNEIDIVGREKSTGLYQYFRFIDINEVDFP
jgi:hypothetical protein